jgi:hypothetical protein
MNRRANRTDSNHTEIMEALKRAGIKPFSLAAVGDGCGDILAGFRGVNVLLEVKDGNKPPSARKLTAAEEEFHATWPGQIAVVSNPEAAVLVVLGHAKAMGRI